MNNSNIKVVEFDHFNMQAGLPSFVLSPGQWIVQTHAVGIYVSSGKYDGTYTHKEKAILGLSSFSTSRQAIQIIQCFIQVHFINANNNKSSFCKITVSIFLLYLLKKE